MAGAIPGFLPSRLYGVGDEATTIARQERQRYASRCWHPLAAASELPPQGALAVELLGQPLLLTRLGDAADGAVHQPRAFLNRCPHRGVALLAAGEPARQCRRLVCPYHGWSYSLQGHLLAAAREAEFVAPFERQHWPLQPLACRQLGPLIWVALGPDPLPLEQQLDLVLAEAAALYGQPRQLLERWQTPLACNWKIAHDNTLDDYHVAIAHPTTLHREQGPVRRYRHALSPHANLLATPHHQGGSFYTFGLAPWTHLLLWPDGRLALIQFLPEANDPQRCTMAVDLLGAPRFAATAAAWRAELQGFLEEDRRLVESAQRGYASGLKPGPAHRLEQRLLQWQALYRRWMELE
ncbi:MAG: aromatic ring-hydroxylating dioxygenase subunit alpha [Cyanobacteriota bacterium]|nr:aromatic ring-hydroxylating dioxygenase subunit alpha [Cyanobacteriota bacterium]